ncbi:anti-sigma factor [Aquibium microcysteis]|uniref:anti-sigma factor n=1 Tax=Aquibium microcysteis TaxID=675281 RepID=UPI00165CFF9C|nr:anti-sigma factor [Aquibium microcysteis]
MSARDDRMARAGDYVLGLMDEAERLRAEADMATDAEFRAAVDSLAARMATLDDTAGRDPVPEGMWAAVEARLGEADADAAPASTLAVDSPPPVPVVDLAARRRQSTWRPALMAAGIAAALGIGYLAGTTLSPRPQPVVVVVLDTPDAVPGAIFEAFADDTVRIVPLRDFAVPEGKTLQVWTLYDPAVGPVSLGTLPRATPAVLRGPDQPLPKADQLYEITLEPAPGSPTGKPTGPILVKGFATRLPD